jgi:hypothetical protein
VDAAGEAIGDALMKAKLFASLEAALDQWTDKQSEGIDWPNVIVGDRTVELMARAAAAVLDACQESQDYGERNGHFERKA